MHPLIALITRNMTPENAASVVISRNYVGDIRGKVIVLSNEVFKTTSSHHSLSDESNQHVRVTGTRSI